MSRDEDKSTGGTPRSSFIKSVSVLVGGTALAHGITAIALPVLSRLYTPADFSALAVYTSLVAIISVAACLRFDVAVSLPSRDSDAANLLALGCASALVVSLMVAVPVLLVPERIATWLNQSALQSYLWLLPLGIMLAASYNALQGWMVRRKEFGQLAQSRITQSVAATGTQLGMGLGGLGVVGLLVGYSMNTGAACLVLGHRIARRERKALRAVAWSRMCAMFVEYHRFPRYSMFEALSNSAAIQIPIIMIAAVAAGPEAGYLSMAMYVMQAPMALVGTAIGQVYLSRAPDEHRAGRLGVFTAEVFGGLLKAGLGPLLFVGILSPAMFGFIFGEDWRRAGNLVAWMTPWFIMQFLTSPISMALHVTGRQSTAMALQHFSLIVRVAAVWLSASIFPTFVSEIYSVSGFVVYGVYAILVLQISRAPLHHLMSGFRKALPINLGWTLIAVAMVVLLDRMQH